MSRVAISKDVLIWAIHRCGLEIDELVQKFPKIHQWTSGEAQPTLRQLELLAKTTLTPLGYFFLSKPPKEQLPIPYFRTNKDKTSFTPSPDLLDTVQIMQQRQAWMQEFLMEQGKKELSFVKSVQLNEKPESIVKRMLETLGLNKGWAAHEQTWTEALRTMRQVIENSGILVVVNGIVGNNTHRCGCGSTRGWLPCGR